MNLQKIENFMEHIKLRCNHCQREYTYCTYGNGPEYGTEQGCSMEYCAECQKAIDKAFAKIKVKFEPRYVEIKPAFGLDKVLEGIKLNQVTDSSVFSFNVYCSGGNGYENVEEYTHNGKTFHVEYDDGGEKHYFIQVEYDIENKKYNVDKPWQAEDMGDSYRFYKSLSHHMTKMTEALASITAKNIDPPLGEIFFMDTWDVETPKKEIKEPQPKPHKKTAYSFDLTGAQIKLRLQLGQGDCAIILAKGIEKKNIIDIIDYRVTFERYEDENVIRIINIAAC